jgi:ADP-ribosyl-[dinitrogen reductase] hydrolase
VRRTSITHPLEIAVVTAGPPYGRIGITFCPGKYDQHAMSGHWDRDLALAWMPSAIGAPQRS